jgi:hypothetical protein
VLEERIATVRRFWEAFGTNDADSFLAALDPGVEIDFSRSRAPYRGIYLGHPGALEWLDAHWSAWEAMQAEAFDFVDAGMDVLVSSIRGRFQGREGIELSVQAGTLWRFEGTLIRRYALFQDRAEALQAAGLSDGPPDESMERLPDT